MTPRQSFGLKIAAAIAALALVFYVGSDWLRWWVFEGRIHNVLMALPKKASAADIVSVRPKILAEARSLWFRPESIDLEIRVEQHTSNGYAYKEDQTECYWFVVATARQGSRWATWEQRIDNQLPVTEDEALEKGDVLVRRRGPPPGG
jgi:hypothetical protein